MNWLDALRLLTDMPAPTPEEKTLHDIVIEALEEKCVRCGQVTRYTRPGDDGLPTCPACLPQLRRARAEGRRCPVDGAVLRCEHVSNVVIDRCPDCGGVWLEDGELELITRAAAQAAHRSVAEAADLLSTVLVGLPRRKST